MFKKIGGLFKRTKWESLGIPVSQTTLRNTLIRHLHPTCIHLRDKNFRAIPLDKYLKLVDKIWDGPPRKYKSDTWDCDDTARKFLSDLNLVWAKKSRGNEALTHGYLDSYVTMGYHVFIWVMTPDGSLTYIEPARSHVVKYKISSTPLIGT